MSGPLVSLREAADWASSYLKKDVRESNISYLVNYARIKKYDGGKNRILVDRDELKDYYDRSGRRQGRWKGVLGEDLNWGLSFDHLTEAETTKHVHRLHPYKGKFIPQLVEYFLDGHVNDYKDRPFFGPGDVVLDPFMGSGTTLIQASELGIHSIGIDVSEFNCLMARVKTADYDLSKLDIHLLELLQEMQRFCRENFNDGHDRELKRRLSDFNARYFPNPEYKQRVGKGELVEEEYGEERLEQFVRENDEFLSGTCGAASSREVDGVSFLAKWFTERIQLELSRCLQLTERMADDGERRLMRLILSRTARSCRATTHYDLATLKDPQKGPYYCYKHKKLCTPVNSIMGHLSRNVRDTVERLQEYATRREEVFVSVIHADSRTVDILEEVGRDNPPFHRLLRRDKIAGVFTSPPYVGQIDYHEQHAYAYELLDISRRDEGEIGPLFKGSGKRAREEYVQGISSVLQNVGRYVKDDGQFFIVANDKFDLYPGIAERSEMEVVQRFKRPVLNRTERDRQPYCEIIFQLRKK